MAPVQDIIKVKIESSYKYEGVLGNISHDN